ncbi:MAG: hypothetical protein ACKOFI_08905, partial [Phycisphaerales bacterium]
VQRVPVTEVTWSTSVSGAFGRSFSCIVADQTAGLQSQLHGPDGRSGSLARRVNASQDVLVREEWVGLGIPCPRMVSLAAIGGAMVELALTCAARQGCTVSGSMSVAGACSSLGNASAALESRTVSGTATYRSLERKVKVSGRIGANVDDDGFGIDGQISSEQEWELDGDGSVVGAAMYAVTHDRTYCAFTNRAYVRRTSGQASAVASATVPDTVRESSAALALPSELHAPATLMIPLTVHPCRAAHVSASSTIAPPIAASDTMRGQGIPRPTHSSRTRTSCDALTRRASDPVAQKWLTPSSATLASAWPGIARAVVDHVQRVSFTELTWPTSVSGTLGSSFSCAVADQTPGPQSQLHGPEGRSGS